jgi:hypothetical protein
MKKLFNNSPILSKLGKRNPFKSNNGKNKDLNDKKEFETPNNNEKRNSLFNNNNPFENDDSYFSIKKTKTSNLFKQRQSAILPENFKLIGLSNFQKDHDFLINSQKRRENKKPVVKYLIYEDTILENELFMPSPYSYPGDYSNKSKLLQDFDEDYSDTTDDSNLNNSFSYKIKKEDNLYRTLTMQAKQIENYINLDKKNNLDPLYVDEKEIKKKNIDFLEGRNENIEINFFEKTSNKNNISYISLNLFIKKIAQDHLRTKYFLLYKSFLEQFSIFLSINIFIEKIINAFYYYKKQTSKEYPELINLLNNIISNKYNLIKDDKNIITKLKNLYKEIKNASWLKDYLKQDTLNVHYILENDEDEFELNFTKYSMSQRNKNIIFIGEDTPKKAKRLSVMIKKNNTLFLNQKETYFYIFDYTEEEIAISLTSICYSLICKINSEELLNCNFSKKNNNERSPNVMKFIQRLDKLNLFIIEDICSYDEVKKRAEAITKWVKIAEECKKLYNFNDTLLITTCFSNYLLKRLALTCKKVPKSTTKKMSELKKFCNNNQRYLNIRREIVKRQGRFYIPYIGIITKEIVNLEEKYKYILDNGNINCLKLQKLYIVIQQFFSFKKHPFAKVPLKDLDILGHIDPKTEDQIEMMIKKIEPKLIISSGGDRKRKTRTDAKYYFKYI